MTRMKMIAAAISVTALLTGPAHAAGQPDQPDDMISLNQAIGRIEQQNEKQSEAITKLLDWFSAMKTEIDTLKAQVAAKPANPAPAPAPAAASASAPAPAPAAASAPASADVIPPPAYPPQPPVVQPVQPAAPVPPAPAPAAASPAAPVPAAPVAPAAAPASALAPATGQQVAAISPSKSAEQTPIVGVVAKLATIDRSGKPVEIAAFPSKAAGLARAADADAAIKKMGVTLSPRGRVQTAFDALLKIDGDGGRYAFSLVADRDSNRNSSCSLSLAIGGVKVMENDVRVVDGKAVAFASADVEGPGAAKVTASAVCEGLISLTLLAKPPGSAGMEPAQTFYLSEAN